MYCKFRKQHPFLQDLWIQDSCWHLTNYLLNLISREIVGAEKFKCDIEKDVSICNYSVFMRPQLRNVRRGRNLSWNFSVFGN